MTSRTIVTLTLDGGVRVDLAKTCVDCKKTKPHPAFYRQVGGDGRVPRCRPCDERRHMQRNDAQRHWPIADLVGRKVAQANRRERFKRSRGEPLGAEEAERRWSECGGRCENCRVPLTFEWMPRAENADHAVIDRVDTSENRTYAGNMAWLCTSCNTEKGGWDLLAQRDAEIRRLKKKLRRLRRERTVDYASVLIAR